MSLHQPPGGRASCHVPADDDVRLLLELVHAEPGERCRESVLSVLLSQAVIHVDAHAVRALAEDSVGGAQRASGWQADPADLDLVDGLSNRLAHALQ